jgi:hypothetical protein
MPAEAPRRATQKHVAESESRGASFRAARRRLEGENVGRSALQRAGYLGDDPDPNIRFQLLRDLDARYGGGGD